MDLLIATLEQSLLFFPLALGLFISFRIMKLTDLTVDGSFVLGAAIFAKTFLASQSIALGILAALAGGALAGLFVSYLQKNQKMDSLIAGILTAFMLYSVNLMIMGLPNLSLLSYTDELQSFARYIKIMMLVLSLLIVGFFYTHLGLKLRALGNNPQLLTYLGKPVFLMQCCGLAAANALAALAGAFTSISYGYADLYMGLGVALIGIGTVAIGGHLYKYVRKKNTFHPLLEIISIAVGVFLYFFALNLLLTSGLDPANLKLALGFILILVLKTASYKRVQHGA
jgi:putative ABC transport system permease protein